MTICGVRSAGPGFVRHAKTWKPNGRSLQRVRGSRKVKRAKSKLHLRARQRHQVLSRTVSKKPNRQQPKTDMPETKRAITNAHSDPSGTQRGCTSKMHPSRYREPATTTRCPWVPLAAARARSTVTALCNCSLSSGHASAS